MWHPQGQGSFNMDKKEDLMGISENKNLFKRNFLYNLFLKSQFQFSWPPNSLLCHHTGMYDLHDPLI